MGEPIEIVDIAKKLINFSGLKPGKDIGIVLTRFCPGEKPQGEPHWKGEGIVPTENRKITMLKPSGLNPAELFSKIERFEEGMRIEDTKGIIGLLEQIVPESRISKDM